MTLQESQADHVPRETSRIVRQIVQLSDGKVWATSEEGQGAVLHVELPLLEATSFATLAA
jgi:K+-sensing histidine kinase KdpD